MSSPGPGRRAAGLLAVLVAVLFQALWLGWPAALLSVGLLVSYGVWGWTPWSPRPGLARAYGAGVLVFLIHVAEERLTGFAEDLPALVGRAAWSPAEFLVFNGVWAAIFTAAGVGLRTGSAFAVLPVLFLALVGGIGNGVFHVALALRAGGYFPGLATAPLCFTVGVWILRNLYGTRRSSNAGG